MAKIILIGDSWGVPNYHGSPGVPAELHTEFLLRKYGHEVINFSVNGSSNSHSIDNAEGYVIQGNKVDWIVWFHTDMIKDRNASDLNLPFTTKELIYNISKKVYTKFNKLIKQIQAKTFIIGASAAVLDNIDDYIKYDYIIRDWRSDIVGKNLPLAYAHHYIDILEHKNNIDTLEDKIQILNAKSEIIKAMENSKFFPDKLHPGKDPHKELSELVHKCIQKL